MVFFGYGSRSKTKALDQYHVLVLTYKIFHIMWLFQIAWGMKYLMQVATEQGWKTYALSPQDADAMNAKDQLKLNPWWQWGLLALPAIALLAALGSFMAAFIHG